MLCLPYLFIFLILNCIFLQYTVEGKGQTSLLEMRRGRIIQRWVLVDERSVTGGSICPFQKSRLKYSHLQRVPSSAFPVKCHKTYASTPGDVGNECPACTLWVRCASKCTFQLCMNLCLQICPFQTFRLWS